MKKLLVVLIFVLTTSMVLTACKGSSTTAKSTAPATSTANSTSTTSASTAKPTTTSPSPTPLPVVPADPIKIGLLEDLTGAIGVYGTAYAAGEKMAIQIINDAGGIKSLKGAKIAYVLGQGDSTAATATSEVERLVNAEKVLAILGPTSTAEALAAIPLFEKYKVPGMTVLADSTQYQKGYRYLFGTAVNSQARGINEGNFIDWLAKKYNAPTDKIGVATLTPSLTAQTDTMITRLAELGYKNIVSNETFQSSVTDQSPLVLKLKAAGATLVIYHGASLDAIAFLKACATYDFTPWLVTSSSVFDGSVPAGLGAEPAKAILTRPNLFGIGISILTDAYRTVPSLMAFQDAFQKANPGNKFDGALVAGGAQKVFVLAKALEIAGSRNPEDIANALRKVDIQAPDPYLVNGDAYPRLTMSDSGLIATGNSTAIQFSDDLSRLQSIWPESIASTAPRVKK